MHFVLRVMEKHKKYYRSTKVLLKKLLFFNIYYSTQIYHLSNLLALYYDAMEILLPVMKFQLHHNTEKVSLVS